MKEEHKPQNRMGQDGGRGQHYQHYISPMSSFSVSSMAVYFRRANWTVSFSSVRDEDEIDSNMRWQAFQNQKQNKNSHGWRILAYLQKWKACSGLHGLQGLVGVGLKLRGVRLQVKWSVVNSCIYHIQDRNPHPHPPTPHSSDTCPHEDSSVMKSKLSLSDEANGVWRAGSRGICLVLQRFDIDLVFCWRLKWQKAINSIS